MKPSIARLFSAIVFALGALFLSGVNGFAANSAGAISETTPLDVVLVIDASDSMTYDVEAGEPMRDPSQCNPSHNCHPFEEAKDAAKAFVDQLNFPDDRVSVVTFDNEARVDLGFSADKIEIQNTIDALGVVEPDVCDTASGPCREYERDDWGNIIDLDGDGIGDQYLGFRCPIYNQTGNPSTCTTTAIGQGLLFAGNEFDNTDTFREGSRRVVILLTDGAANAPSFVCPNSTWTAPFCRDLSATSRHCLSADYTSCIAAGGVVDPDKYDADDYARDMADFVSGDQEALVYTIGLGPLVQTSVPIDSNGWGAGEQLLRYTADMGNGAYYYAPSGEQLDEIFQDIYSHLSSGPKTWVVTKTDDTDDGSCNDDCSLREAIASTSAGDTVTFIPSLAGQTIALTSTITINTNLAINGSNLASHVQVSGDTDSDGLGDTSVFMITAGTTTEIADLDIIAGHYIEVANGGGINNYGSLTLTNCSFSGNTGDQGGAVHNRGSLTISNSFFTNNTAIEGGVILNDANTLALISDSTFTNNTAVAQFGLGGAGGSVGNAGTLTVVNSNFVNNSGEVDGGAIINVSPGSTTIYSSTFTGNSTPGFGGAIDNYTGVLTVTGSNFSGNSAGLGGAINAGNSDSILEGSDVTVEDSTLSTNTASVGGGIHAYSGTVTVSGSTFDSNIAESGGGIVNIEATVDVVNSTFYNNSSTQEPVGAIYNGGTLTVQNSTLSGNDAGLYNESVGSVILQNAILANSTAGYDCYNNGGTLASETNNLIELNGNGEFACGTPVSIADPLLGPLEDNGGPTWTMNLLPGSPAIDAGDDASCLDTDQRGIARPQGAHCDIGAYEYEPPPTSIQSIDLEAGWNLVSFNLQPLDTGIATVLSSIDGDYNLVYAWDASGAHSESGNWMKYDPTAPAYQNSLDHLDETMGFWIYMLSPQTLEIMGYQPTTTHVTLADAAGGWNLVAYPSSIDGVLSEALSDHGVDDDFSLVYAYHADDAMDPWKLFDRTSAPYANDLLELASGWGYWIRVSADNDWSVEYSTP